MIFSPNTAREALLEIRRRVELMRGEHDIRYLHTKDAAQALEHLRGIDAVAQAGLDRNGPVNFELSDQLADRLAEAHKALTMVKEHLYGKLPDGDNEIEGIIAEALALPPDLESMIERRVGRTG